MEEKLKLYSQKAIGFATFFGGPLAAGILIRRNCLNLGRDKQAINALFIGIISTVLLFVGLFTLPETLIDKIPQSLLPLIYTAIIYLIVEKIQGKELKQHKADKGEFYSGWQAAGVGAISMLIIAGGIFGYIYLLPEDSWDIESYDAGLVEFDNNEVEALKLFDLLDYGTTQEIVNYIDNNAIPLWKKNIEVVRTINSLENIPEKFLKQNQLLMEYAQLRLESTIYMRKAIFENTSIYDEEIIKRNNRIEKIIEEL